MIEPWCAADWRDAFGPLPVPRLPDHVLRAMVFLFPSVEAAEVGQKAGGTGFFVSLPFSNNGLHHFYVVTNRHVVDSGNRTVRVNWLEWEHGSMFNHEIDDDDWVRHPTCDVAIAWVPLNVFIREALAFPADDLLMTRGDFEAWEIGPGDDVVLVSRHIEHQGTERNRPIVHSGMLSLSPPDLVYNPTLRHKEPAFLVESRSWGGFSGSPVLVYRHPNQVDLQGREPIDAQVVLGVLWGHLRAKEPVVDNDRKPTGNFVWVNTGTVAVAPAWCIRDLLYDPRLVERRAHFENRWNNLMVKESDTVTDDGDEDGAGIVTDNHTAGRGPVFDHSGSIPGAGGRANPRSSSQT